MVRSVQRTALGALVLVGAFGLTGEARADDKKSCGGSDDKLMDRVHASFHKLQVKPGGAGVAKAPAQAFTPAAPKTAPPMVLAKYEEEPASEPAGGIARVADPAVAEEEVAAEPPFPGDEPALEGAPMPGDEPALEIGDAPPEAAPAPVVASAPAPAAEGPKPAPAAPETADVAPTTVTGSIVLGLLPYTVAGGAFGLGTSVGVDDFSKDAGVVFGPSASLGVTDWFTLGASIPFASAPVQEERVTGLGNVGVSAQFMFYDDKDSGISLAATPGVALPSPSASASSSVVPDLKASGAVNFGAVALNLTARGSVDLSTEGEDAAAGFDSALSLILVDETWAPFLEAAVSVTDSVVPIGAAGLNFAPGGGALLTAGVPVAFDGETVKPGMSFTAYFETELWGGSKGVAKVSASPVTR